MRTTEYVDPVMHLIPSEEYQTIFSQDKYELEPGFMGFTRQYEALSLIIPLHYTIIDFGCYLAAQSYFFRSHKKYIGVDVISMTRFRPSNAEHYIGSIQSFIADMKDIDLRTTFAIMNYVPDDDARDLVKQTFRNVFVFYPA